MNLKNHGFNAVTIFLTGGGNDLGKFIMTHFGNIVAGVAHKKLALMLIAWMRASNEGIEAFNFMY